MNVSSIQFKTKAILCLLTIFIFSIVGVTFYIVNSQSADARIIDIAGRQRMLTQKMTKEVLALATALETEASNIEELRSGLLGTVSLFDRSLSALKDGGVTLGTSGSETMLPESTGKAKLQLNKVLEMWVPVKESTNIVADPELDVDSIEFAKAIIKLKEGNIPLLKASNKAVVVLKESSERKTVFLKTMLSAVFILTIVIVSVSFFLANRVLFRPLRKVVDMVRDIAEGEGDLTKRLDDSRKDEIGEMAGWFNQFLDKIHEVVSKVVSSAQNIASTSEQLTSSSSGIAQGTEEQAAQSEAVATAMGEMNATVTEVASNSQSAAEAAKDAQSTAVKGGEIVSAAVRGIEELTNLVERTSEEVKSLGDNSEQIGEIIATIDDIADQTNLLALNAAIEAARAGEQGRGFAVVADEVRQLAERTTKATAEVRDKIGTVQEETAKVVQSMEIGTKKSEEGVELARSAGSALEEIVQGVDKVSEMIQQIATAAEQQSATTEEISTNVDGIASITSETANQIKGNADAIQGLNSTAEELKTLIEGFKV